jgi:hypothetical protein
MGGIGLRQSHGSVGFLIASTATRHSTVNW